MPMSFEFIAAPFTPFFPDGSLNLALIQPYADKLHRDGVAGVFICGTTGEGMSLSVTERLEVTNAWKTAVAGRMKLIVHVGHPVQEEAASLARHAQSMGVDGLASIGPIFFAPPSVDALVEINRIIAAAAPDIPYYYYHMPSMSRVGFEASDCLPRLIERIPNFSGIKFTHEDIADYRRCQELAGDRLEIFFGRDEILLDGLRAGARSAVGSTYNFAAPLYRRVVAAYAAGQVAEAERWQLLCRQAIERIVRFGGLSGIKATLALSGIDCGPPRLPLCPVITGDASRLADELGDLGYLDAIRAS